MLSRMRVFIVAKLEGRRKTRTRIIALVWRIIGAFPSTQWATRRDNRFDLHELVLGTGLGFTDKNNKEANSFHF